MKIWSLFIAITILSSGCFSLKRTVEVNSNSGVKMRKRVMRLGPKKPNFFGAPKLYDRTKYVAPKGELIRIEKSTLSLKRPGNKPTRSKIKNYKDGKKVRVISNIRGKRRVKEYNLPEENLIEETDSTSTEG